MSKGISRLDKPKQLKAEKKTGKKHYLVLNDEQLKKLQDRYKAKKQKEIVAKLLEE